MTISKELRQAEEASIPFGPLGNTLYIIHMLPVWRAESKSDEVK